MLLTVCPKQFFWELLRISDQNFLTVLYVILSMFSLISHQHSFTSKTFSGYQCYREIKNPDSKYSTATGERDRGLTCSAVPFVL